MLSRHHRWAFHAVAAVALSGLAVVLTGTAGNAASATLPDSYGSNAAASSFRYTLDRNPAAVPAVEDAFHTEIPYAETSLDSSGGASGRAFSVFPGDGPLGVPSLICVFSPAFCSQVPNFPPNFPLEASAQYPSNPDSSATLSAKQLAAGPFTAALDNITAHADPMHVSAAAVIAGSTFASLVSARSATSDSSQHFEGSTLVADAESVLKGVSIGGGVIQIDTLRSTAVAKVDGGRISSSSADTTVTGATVQGNPVTIDSTGIHVTGQGDSGAAAKAVNSALAKLDAAGISVRSLGITKLARRGVANASTGGLLIGIDKTVNAPALPPQVPLSLSGDYFGSVILAGAGAAAYATPAIPLGNVSLPVTPPTGAGVAGGSSSGGAVPGATLPGGAAMSASGPAAGVPPTLSRPGQRPAALLGVDLTNKRLRILALVLLGYPLLMLLAAPLRVPARLPGAR